MGELQKDLSLLWRGITSVVRAGNLASLPLLLAGPRPFLGYISEILLLRDGLANSKGIRQALVTDIFPAARSATTEITYPRGSEQWFGPWSSLTQDLVNLCLLAKAVNPKTIFEIGTLNGYTAYQMAMNSKAEVFSLDLPPGQDAALGQNRDDKGISELHAKYSKSNDYCFNGTPEAERIRLLTGDSALFDYSPFYGKVDLFFIDGAHDYGYVKNDTEKALLCCHEGSVIAWHDFGRLATWGVTKYVREFSKSHKVYVIPGGALAYCLL